MEKINHSRRLAEAVAITLGCLISSSSINLFLLPNHLLSGGLTGIGMIVYFLTGGLPVGAQVLVYNVPLLIAALRMLGREYFVGVLFGTVGIIVVACCYVSSEADREEEKHRNTK